jgi:hypothetical protein
MSINHKQRALVCHPATNNCAAGRPDRWQFMRGRWIAGPFPVDRWARIAARGLHQLDRSRRIAGHCVAQLRALGVPRPYVWGNAGAARWAYFTRFSPGKRKPAGHCWRAGNISALGGPIWSTGQLSNQERKQRLKRPLQRQRKPFMPPPVNAR